MSPSDELSSQLTELHLAISEFLQNLESEKAEESDVISPADKTNASIYGTPSEYNGTYNGTPRQLFSTFVTQSFNDLFIYCLFVYGGSISDRNTFSVNILDCNTFSGAHIRLQYLIRWT